MAQLLIDTQPLVLNLSESKDGSGKIRFAGEFGRTDKATANGRFYSPKLMERELGRLLKPISERKVLGELDHPADGRTRLQRVSHIITDLHTENHKVLGEAHPLDTPNGRILSALAAAGVAVGVSSRGYGSTNTRPDGVEEVAEDFRLDTYDFVFQPADETAYPNVYTEEKQVVQSLEDGTMKMTIEVLREQYPELVEMIADEVEGSLLSEDDKTVAVTEAVAETERRVERRLREKFSGDILKHVERVQEQAIEQARSEAASDPQVAGALGLIENIAALVAPFGGPIDQRETIADREGSIEELEAKLAERELEVQASKIEANEMRSLALEGALALHLERKLRGESDERRNAVVNLIGDLKQFESRETVDARFEAVCNELDSAKPEYEPVEEDERSEFEQRIGALEHAQSEMKAEAEAAATEVEQANDRTRRALDAAQKATAQAYAEGIALGHPQGEQLRKLAENAENITEVDSIVESLTEATDDAFGGGAPSLDEDQAERIRRRISQGKERSIEEDTHGRSPEHGGNGNGNGNGKGKDDLLESMGLGEGEFDRLAGTTRQ